MSCACAALRAPARWYRDPVAAQWHYVAVDPLATSASITTLLQAAAAGANPDRVGKRAPRRAREAAYVSFQKSGVRAASTASLLRGLVAMDPPRWRRPLLATAYLLTGAAVERATRVREGSFWSGASRLVATLGAAELAGEVARDQFARTTVVGQFSAVHEFLESLVEIRMIGSPKPRAMAEQITSLLGELFGSIPAGRPGKEVRGLPGFRSRDRAWLKRQEYFEDCTRALGRAFKDFTVVARADLGRGNRWWQRGRRERTHFWQFWRAPDWPGGWPGPDGRELVRQSRQSRGAIGQAKDLTS